LAVEAPTYADYCVFGMFMWGLEGCSTIDVLEVDDPVAVWPASDCSMRLGGMAPRSAPSIQCPGV